MRILIVGATGTIGRAITAALSGQHDLVRASRSQAPERVDISDPGSIRALYARIGPVDAVVCAAGQPAFKPLPALEDGDLEVSLREKLMGQVNLVRLALDQVTGRASFTLTSGIVEHPEPGTAAICLVNGALEAFCRAAALDLPRGIRLNIVRPPWVQETLQTLGRAPDAGLPSARVAQAYLRSVEGTESGLVIRPTADGSSP